MIRLLPSKINCPQTDKGNIIRAQLYNIFSAQIEEMYARPDKTEEGSQKLDFPPLELYFMTVFLLNYAEVSELLLTTMQDDSNPPGTNF